MQGYVSHEKQKFERLAQEMKTKDKDLRVKNETLRKVEELIKNSPAVRNNRKPLQENNTSEDTTVSIVLAYTLCSLSLVSSYMSQVCMYM